VNVICSQMKLRVGGGEGLMRPFNKMVGKLFCATVLLVTVAMVYRAMGSFDSGKGDCVAAARSFTYEEVLLNSKTLWPEGTPCTDSMVTTNCTHDTVYTRVDDYTAYETCMGYFRWNGYLVLFTVGLLVLQMILKVLVPISLMTKMNQLMATATSDEPVRPYVLDRKILDLTIDTLRALFVHSFSNQYGEKKSNIINHFFTLSP